MDDDAPPEVVDAASSSLSLTTTALPGQDSGWIRTRPTEERARVDDVWVGEWRKVG